MEGNLTSTVAWRSNLQPVNASAIIDDKEFLKHVHDPFALEILKKKNAGSMTALQMREFEHASMHCAFAFKDDYPFGTVIGENGKERVVCKCLNISCGLFGKCRPDFDEDELRIGSDNEAARLKRQQFEIALEESVAGKKKDDAGSSDEPAVATILAPNQDNKNGDSTPGEKQPGEPDTGVPDNCPDIIPVITLPEERPEWPVASFASFKAVEQSEIITAPVSQRTIVNAGPGTGKTFTLIEKIKYMLGNGEADPDDIMVLCFSRAAVEVIRSRLQDAADKDELPMGWLHVDIRTFDSFATYMIAWVKENEPSILPETYMLETQSYDERIRTATDILTSEKDMLDGYEHVIIDEVQDLVGSRAQMVLSMLAILPDECGFTLLGDSCQALYDYMAKDDPEIMSSGRFYQHIFNDYRGACYVSLEQNYRQSGDFAEISIPYRKAILSGQVTEMIHAATVIQNSLKSMETDIRHFTNADAKSYLKKGTLGILTRTNGQALQVSSWLHAENVRHMLQHSSATPDLAFWISNVFRTVEGDIISESSFQNVFAEIYPSASYVPYWSALIDTQIDADKRYYEKELLLRGLLEKARNPLLYSEPDEGVYNITISNIHRAKGKEFDTVLVLDDVISAMTDEDNADELEHKVCYVALTRLKKQIERVELSTQYIYISRDGSRRCFKAGRRGRFTYLSHFEVGVSGDFDIRSFAVDSTTQESILNNLHIGDRLKLLKCPEDTKSYVIYRLVPEEDEKCILGYTTEKFARDMQAAILRIYKNCHDVKYKYFPERFTDIYLDALTTCISSWNTGINGAINCNGMFVWTGLSITGFAQQEKEDY